METKEELEGMTLAHLKSSWIYGHTTLSIPGRAKSQMRKAELLAFLKSAIDWNNRPKTVTQLPKVVGRHRSRSKTRSKSKTPPVRKSRSKSKTRSRSKTRSHSKSPKLPLANLAITRRSRSISKSYRSSRSSSRSSSSRSPIRLPTTIDSKQKELILKRFKELQSAYLLLNDKRHYGYENAINAIQEEKSLNLKTIFNLKWIGKGMIKEITNVIARRKSPILQEILKNPELIKRREACLTLKK